MLNTIIRRGRTPLAAGLLAGACLALVGGTVAMAAPSPVGSYTVPLHQTPPITAAGFGSQEKVCDSIPDTEDGWHFVLPGDATHFVSLTVTFSPGGTQTITTFGPPTDKHAFAASAPGAELTSASAVVITDTGKKKVDWFNLSHTCPATVTPPPTPTPTPTHTHPHPTPTPTHTHPHPTPTPTHTHPHPTPTPTHTHPHPTPTPTHTHKPHHPHHHKRHHHKCPRPPAPPAPTPSPVPHEFPVTG